MGQRAWGLCLLLASAAAAMAADRYEKWLKEEVVWIIGAEERKAFEQLRDNAARDRFIEEFWARRDPTPGTPANEYREEHAARLKYVTQHFREGSTPGWKTDRGRVYIIHGPPLGRNLQQDTEVWSYNSNPYAEYYQGPMTLVFSRSGAVFQQRALSESVMGQERMRMYDRGPKGAQDLMATSQRMRLVSAGPGIGMGGAILTSSGETDRYIADWLRSPGDAIEKRLREQERRREAWEELHQQVQAETRFDSLSVSLDTLTFRLETDWHLAFTAELPAASVEFQADGELRRARVDVFCQVTAGAGDEVADRLDETLTYTLLPDRQYDKLSFSNHFRLPPGDYRLGCWFQDLANRRVGGSETTLQLPAPAPGEVVLSSLVLTQAVEPDQGGTAQGLVFQGMRFLPRRPEPADRNSPLYAYFEVYPPPDVKDPVRRYLFDYSLATDQAIFLQVPQQSLVPSPDSRICPMALMFDISRLPPGTYRFTLKVTDTASHRSAVRVESFWLP